MRGPDHSERIVASALTGIPAPAGVRIRGLLTPDVTGEYTLHIAGSQNAALWLSTDDSRFNKQRVAWHLQDTNEAQWGKYSTQSTIPLQLEAGVSYYLEAQVMNGAGLGHIALGWTPPGGTTPAPIPTANLRYPTADPADLTDNNLPDWWEEQTGLDQLDELAHPGARSEYGDPDQDGISNFDEYRLDSDPLDPEYLANGITRETWTSPGMGSSNLSTLTNSPRFYDLPNETQHVPGIDDALRGSQYANRYRGFLVAPATGSYRFWITGTCQVQLWLADGTITPHGESAPRTDRFGKRLIAWNEASPTGQRWPKRHNFDRTPSQRSQIIHLVAGETYYIEALHKRGTTSGQDHISVAWQPPGQTREIIPAEAFLANSPHPEDEDDDGLPDAWQAANGLDAPHLSVIQRSQFGDPDGDGLTNLLEYQYGTDPLDADTDGDGISDYDEIFYYGTDPLVSNTLAPQSLAGLPTPQQYDVTATSGGWTHNSDGSISARDPRGTISYQFTVPTGEPGIHEILITGSAIGDIRTVERLPLVLSLNGGSPFAKVELVSQNGGPSTAKALTPWLSPGEYTLTILHDNDRAIRRLRIHDLDIVLLGGFSSNPEGHPDWAFAQTTTAHTLTRVPAESLTSPASIEGIATSLGAVTLSVIMPAPGGGGSPPAAEPVTHHPGVNQGFFADVPLSPDGPVTLDADFLCGLITQSETITWVPTNLIEHDELELHIRHNDSMRLTAHPVEGASGSFIINVEGASGSFTTDPQPSDTPLTLTFDAPGTHTLTATWTPEAGPTQTATITLHVHAADFGPSHSVAALSPRAWAPPALGPLLTIENDDLLMLAETTQDPDTGPRTFVAAVHQPGLRRVLARLPETTGDDQPLLGAPSAILATGTVSGFRIDNLDQTRDPQIVFRYQDGTWLMRSTILAQDVPPDIIIRLTAVNQGTVFLNGSNILELRAEDFDANGAYHVYSEWSGPGNPHLCHNVRLFIEP